MLQLNINDEVTFEILSYERHTSFNKDYHGSQAYIHFTPRDTTLTQLYSITGATAGQVPVNTMTLVYTVDNQTHRYRMENVEGRITGLSESWDINNKEFYGELIIEFALYDRKIAQQTDIFC